LLDFDAVLGLDRAMESSVLGFRRRVFKVNIQKPHGIAQVRRISWVRGVGRPDVVSGLLVYNHDRSATFSPEHQNRPPPATKKAP